MRGGGAAAQNALLVPIRGAPLASFSYSPCQTAQSSSFARRVLSAGSLLPLSLRVLHPDQGAAERRRRVTDIFRHACEARRLASRATGGRLSALRVAVFGRGTGASSSGSAHR